MDTIIEFEAYLFADGKSAKTLSSYLSDVKSFHRYLNDLGITDSKKITRTHITGFRNKLLQQGYKPATINKAVNSLNAYTKFLIDKQVLPSQTPLVKSSQDRVKISSDCEHIVEDFRKKN